MHNKLTSEDSQAALKLLERAVAIDPDYAAAYGLAAYCHMRQRQRGWMASSVSTEGVRLARLAAQKGQNDAEALWMAGICLVMLVGEFEDGVGLIERSLLLNPNSASAWMASGMVHAHMSESDVAIAHLRRSSELSPLDPQAYLTWYGTAFAHFAAGRLPEALAWLNKVLNVEPAYLPGLRLTAGICGLLGRLDEGRKYVARVLAIAPDVTLSKVRPLYRAPIKSPDCLETLLVGLCKAGLPD